MLASAGRIVRTVFVALIAIGFLVFAVDNRQTVNVSLFPLPYSAALPQFLLAILCVLLGTAMGGVVASVRLIKLRQQVKAEQARVKALENELKVVQTRPTGTLPIAAKG